MTMLRVHNIRIGGLPIAADRMGFEWRFVAGISPGGTTVTIPLDGTRAEQIAQADAYWRLAGEPVAIDVDCDRIDGTQRVSTRTSIKNLYIHNQDFARVGTTLCAKFNVSDLRWKWKGFPVVGLFNVTRRTNDLDIARAGEEPPVPGQERIVELEDGEVQVARPRVRGGFAPAKPAWGPGDQIVGFRPADILSKHRQFPRFAYRPFTLDYHPSDVMPGPDVQPSIENGRPWTALRLAVALLRGYWMRQQRSVRRSSEFVFVPGVLEPEEWGGLKAPNADETQDNGYTPPRLVHFGDELTTVLPNLLRKAEVRTVVWLDGKLYVTPTYTQTQPNLPSIAPSVERGILYMTDNSVDRPESVVALFRREEETQFTVVSDIASERDNIMENVIRLPEQEELTINGETREYQKGTWLPLEQVLENWGTDTETVRNYWFKGFEQAMALAVFGEDAAGGISEQTERRIAAIRESFRQIFRLSRRDMERILDLRAETTTVVDAQSGTREPSPVWLTYAFIRRHKQRRGTVADVEDLWRNIEYDLKPDGSPADGAPTSPFSVEVMDATLGIIRLLPGTDQGIQEMFPFNIAAPEGKEVKVQRNFDGGNLTNAFPSEDWSMSTNLTVQYLDPNTPAQMLAVEVPPGEVQASQGYHPTYFVADMEETARFDIDGNLVNERMIRARAQSIARSIYGSFQDRLTGSSTWAGWHEVFPVGTAQYTAWTISSGGALETTLAMQEPPPRRDPDVFLDPDLRRVRQQLPAQ